MKAAEIILKLIENVSPDDTAKLDEIDNRVWEYLNSTKLGHKNYRSTPYTRSRDALKTIRPEGYEMCIEMWDYTASSSPRKEWDCSLFTKRDEQGSPIEEFSCCHLSEELAELHAIIQAIAHERGGEGGV